MTEFLCLLDACDFAHTKIEEYDQYTLAVSIFCSAINAYIVTGYIPKGVTLNIKRPNCMASEEVKKRLAERIMK